MVETIERKIHNEIDSDAWQGVPDIIQKLYTSRGVKNKNEADLALANLLPFADLKNIAQASELLSDAIEKKSKILIVGDYDVDGATSTTLAVRALRDFGACDVQYILPDRFVDGYGLSTAIVEKANALSPDLIITVDNGISSVDGVALARKYGIKVLITDHHLAGDAVPQDCVIVNPNQKDDNFPSKNLAGVGVIFYVMAALRAKLSEKNYFHETGIGRPNLTKYLDLVALGTVADVVPLDKNNRILVKYGLAIMRDKNCCHGIKALFATAKRDPARAVSSDLGFAVAPRLNAAGRLDDMTVGVKCLLSDDMEAAEYYAATLDELNKQRRTTEGAMQLEAEDLVASMSFDSMPLGLCLHAKDWHQGVVGLVASRIKDKTNRPVIAFADGDGGLLKGSGRSIKGLHLRDVVAEVSTLNPGLIPKFGGHAMAIGLSIKESDFATFKDEFMKVLQRKLAPELLREKLYTDGVLAYDQITLPTARLLRDAGPWGQCFPEPMFEGEFELIEQKLVGEKHLSMRLRNSNSGFCYRAICFNVDLDKWPNNRCTSIKAVYQLDINMFRDLENLQLIVKNIEARSEI